MPSIKRITDRTNHLEGHERSAWRRTTWVLMLTLSLLLVLPTSFAVTPARAQSSQPAQDCRPNVLLIVADDGGFPTGVPLVVRPTRQTSIHLLQRACV